MTSWETTKYSKWYNSHRKFSFTAKYCIEQFEEGNRIPETIFKPFLKSLFCHSKSEEKVFSSVASLAPIFQEHEMIIPTKIYTNEEKYRFCKSLLVHMKEEEDNVWMSLNLKTQSNH